MKFFSDNDFADKLAVQEYKIAEDYYENKEYDLAFKYYQSSAKKGYPKAINKLGVCYATGRGTLKSHQRAYECYSLAADKGYAGAIHNLGICCYQIPIQFSLLLLCGARRRNR